MTDDRTPFREARDAGLAKRHEQRLAQAQVTAAVKAYEHERALGSSSSHAMRRALSAAALPHLRVQETRPPSGEICYNDGLDPAPAPRPVVDREALERALRDRMVRSNFNDNLHEPLRTQTIDQWADVLAGAVLALLPTEEAASGQEHPQRTDSAATQDPEQAPRLGHGHVREPTRPADAEELAEAGPATGGLTEEDTKASCCTCRTIAPSGWDTVQHAVDPRCPLHAADAKGEGS